MYRLKKISFTLPVHANFLVLIYGTHGEWRGRAKKRTKEAAIPGFRQRVLEIPNKQTMTMIMIRVK